MTLSNVFRLRVYETPYSKTWDEVTMLNLSNERSIQMRFGDTSHSKTSDPVTIVKLPNVFEFCPFMTMTMTINRDRVTRRTVVAALSSGLVLNLKLCRKIYAEIYFFIFVARVWFPTPPREAHASCMCGRLFLSCTSR